MFVMCVLTGQPSESYTDVVGEPYHGHPRLSSPRHRTP